MTGHRYRCRANPVARALWAAAADRRAAELSEAVEVRDRVRPVRARRIAATLAALGMPRTA